MKILLVYPGTIVREIPLNLLYISSSLKKAGFDTKVFELTPYNKQKMFRDANKYIEKEFEKLLIDYQPDIVGISLMTINYQISMRLARIVKEKSGAKIICGGIHPTIAPEETIKEKDVDYICIGEGEKSVVELVTNIQNKTDYTRIKGIWVKENGKIYKNPLRELEENLDDISFPDRDAFPDEYYRDELIGTNILASRGCPYHCSFCQNKYLMNIYKDKGKFVRYRSFENIFVEIEYLIKRYDIKKLYFSDETFTMNKKRILEFCKEYKKRFKLPFMCQTRIDTLDEEIISALKDAGCFHISLAIESGNEEVRIKLLKKPIKNEQIMNAFRLAKKYNLRTQSFNMVGLPGERLQYIFETIEINKKLQPDRILCSIFMPFKGTELGEWCFEKKMIKFDPKKSNNYYNVISIKYDNINPKTILGYQGFFDWYVRLPKKYYKIIDLLRIVYQNLLTTQNPKNRFLLFFRIFLIEVVYQSKRFLPVSCKYQVTKR
jgi:radical SAM superfamily enzyme YgiQ (UPF0313 family)